MTTMTDSWHRVTGGVDTHRDLHVVCALDERGAELGVDSLPTTAAGYRQALRFLRHFGDVEKVGVEGTGSYGAALTRYLQDEGVEGVEVVEINCPDRQRRRSHGKSDPVNAIAAARAVFSGEAQVEPKTRSGNVEAIRALRTADRSARHGRIKALNQMRALLLTGPVELREQFSAPRRGAWSAPLPGCGPVTPRPRSGRPSSRCVSLPAGSSSSRQSSRT
jgi:transposase